MTVFAVTTSNWNNPAFWSGISLASEGHDLDFSALPSGYSVTANDAVAGITISDGTTSFTIGEDGATGTDANLGAPTLIRYFNAFSGSEGGDTLAGGSGEDTIDGGGGADVIYGDVDGLIPAVNSVTYDLSDAVFSYATGANIGDGADGGTAHLADVSSNDVSDLMMHVTTGTTLESGDPVRLSFVNADGDIVVVNNGVVGQSAFGSGAAGSGIFTVTGTDGDGNAIAVLVKFNNNDGSPPSTIVPGHGFYDTDTDPLIFNGTDVELDPAAVMSLDDSLTGGAGDDSLYGGNGDNTLLGGTGSDYLSAKFGDDSMEGGDGDDTLSASHGDDTLWGGDGDDYLAGDYGDDSMVGGLGSDTLQGSFGDDTLIGNAGDDYLYGSYGVDSIDAGDGDDTIGAGRNDGDIVYAGSGSDSIFYEFDIGDDTIFGGEGGTDEDTLAAVSYLTDAASIVYYGDEAGTLFIDGFEVEFSEIEHQYLTQGDDTVDASADSSGSGFRGEGGADSIVAGTGADTIDGGAGTDYLLGGDGADSIAGGDDADTIFGDSTSHNPALIGTDIVSNGDFAGGSTDWAILNGSTGTGGRWDGQGLALGSATNGVDSSASQTLATVPGATYTLAFDYNIFKNGTSASGEFEVRLDGATEVTISDPTDDGTTSASTLTLTFVAGSESTDLTFFMSAAQNISGRDIDIDNVSVTLDSLPEGDDTLDGGAGADVIDGGAGADSLTGGTGDDSLTGGLGDDSFALTTSGGADTIADFDVSDDDSNGFYNDQLDVSDLAGGSGAGGSVRGIDVVVTDDGFGNALLTFPEGETLLLEGVAPSAINTVQQLYAAGVPCFTPGIRIATARGLVPVEDIRPGDLLQTADNGMQPVIWTGSCNLTAKDLNAMPQLRPVLLQAGGLLGNEKPLLVSPQHRFVVDHNHLRRARQCGDTEWFLRAKFLPSLPQSRARVAHGQRNLRYIHILLPAHDVIFAEGVATESFWPGPQALMGLTPKDRRSLFAALPSQSCLPSLRSLASTPPERARQIIARDYSPLARPDLDGRDLRQMGRLRKAPLQKAPLQQAQDGPDRSLFETVASDLLKSHDYNGVPRNARQRRPGYLPGPSARGRGFLR